VAPEDSSKVGLSDDSRNDANDSGDMIRIGDFKDSSPLTLGKNSSAVRSFGAKLGVENDEGGGVGSVGDDEDGNDSIAEGCKGEGSDRGGVEGVLNKTSSSLGSDFSSEYLSKMAFRSDVGRVD